MQQFFENGTVGSCIEYIPREADFKGPLLHVAQSDGSKKNTYLIIINPAYALENTTLHIISYSSWYVFYTRTNCTIFKKLLHEKHL
jgi:hypothetical protein